MMTTIRTLIPASLLIGAVWANAALALNYRDAFFFGDSVTDTGNNAYVLDHTIGLFTSDPLRTQVPTPSQTFVATYPYESDRYSNGPVWAEYFSSRMGVRADPAFSGGTNYAFGGAHMGPLGNVVPPSVRDQVAFYLASSGGRASPNALYVIEGGGNDAREAAYLAFGGGDPTPVISDYVSDAMAAVSQLDAAGANHIVFWNVPNIGRTPEFLALDVLSATATIVAMRMNDAILAAAEGLPARVLRDVQWFDFFGVMNKIIADPSGFGLKNVTSACAAGCVEGPAYSLFWDGLHPTTVGHAILANAAYASVNPEPEIIVLFALGLAGIAYHRRRWFASTTAGGRQSA